MRQPSRLHDLHDPRRHYDGASNPSRRPHQHGQERVRRNRRLSTRPKRRILPLRHRRDEQEGNFPRQRQQPPPPPPRRQSDNVRRDAGLRKRIRNPDRQEQQSPRSSPPRARIQSPRREERLHKIPPLSR